MRTRHASLRQTIGSGKRRCVGIGSGTYSGSGRISSPTPIHIGQAARRTVALLNASSGVVVDAEDQ